MVSKKHNKCKWEFYHEGKNDKPYYLKCKICGRIKRSDLPDIKPCAGSNVAYQSMMKKILGQDVDEADVKDFENKSLELKEKENNNQE